MVLPFLPGKEEIWTGKTCNKKKIFSRGELNLKTAFSGKVVSSGNLWAPPFFFPIEGFFFFP